ncbi:MAG: hypothetical protein KAR20_22395, partial [Candidatus Heimdallarchaeota archaeon]|nr:hypothetical protein [Candidatus Heimdallarchaeota archaeon]
MKKIKLLIYPVFLIILLGLNCKSVQNELIVKFPKVSEAVAITSGPMEHLFASYYGINSWSADQR